jgi:hypothetical protein
MRQNLDQSEALLHWAILIGKETRRGEERISEKGQHEDLGEGPTRGPRTNTVGTGVSKYTSEKKEEFKPWDPNTVKIKAARRRKE